MLKFWPLLAGLHGVAAFAEGTLQVTITEAETGQAVADAVVEVLLPTALQADWLHPVEAVVDQQQKEFIAPVTIVPAGSRVRFPNSDDILHHVYSFSEAKVFELPLYGSDRNNVYQQLFDTPGVVELGCNIHDWMLAYIYVAESDLAAKTDDQGRVTLTGLPAGEYRLRIWHARAEADDQLLQQQAVIRDGEQSELQLALVLARDNRLRRAPGPTRARYR